MPDFFRRLIRYLNYPADTHGKVDEVLQRVRQLSDEFYARIGALQTDSYHLRAVADWHTQLLNELNAREKEALKTLSEIQTGLRKVQVEVQQARISLEWIQSGAIISEEGIPIFFWEPQLDLDDSSNFSRLFEAGGALVLLRKGDTSETSLPAKIAPAPAEQLGARALLYLRVGKVLASENISGIIAQCRRPGDLATAIAAADVTGAPLALIFASDEESSAESQFADLFEEALRKARLSFCTSALARSTLQTHYGKKVWLLPPFARAEDPNGKGHQDKRLTPSELIQWLWVSLDKGFPTETPFEGCISAPEPRDTPYVEPPAPREIHWEMQSHFQALYRLKLTGYLPEFVIDVGASTGYWSHIASQIFPESRYYLVEPLLEKYKQLEGTVYGLHPEFVLIPAAAGNMATEMVLNVSAELYTSSLIDGESLSADLDWLKLKVPVRTLDEISSTLNILGRGLLKIDVQLAEELVLDGAMDLLQRIDVIFIELSHGRFAPQAKTFFEMTEKLHRLGFEYFDYAGCWRNSQTGRLIQQDAIFARQVVHSFEEHPDLNRE